MKVVLFALNGSYSHTNLAIRCLRPGLEASGFEVVFSEFNLHVRTAWILEALYSDDAAVYGFSAYIWNIREMLDIAGELKKLRPQSVIVFGGPEVSYECERFDGCGFIDHIIKGEGEDALPEICRSVRDGISMSRIVTAEPATGVMSDEGILYREGDGRNGSLLYYESSRGCPYSCAYCLSSVTDGVRMKSADQVMKDLSDFEKYKDTCRVVKFVDRTFNANPSRANEIWRRLLDPSYSLRYHFEICASLLNEESFDVLSRFPKGKIQLEAGLQSTNPETLAEVSRHLSPEKVIAAAKRIKDMGNVDIYVDLIAGLPYESFLRFGKSFDDAYFCTTRLQLGFLKLLPGTKLRQDAEKYGYISLSGAPYTVLSSKWLTYSEMYRLEQIHGLYERYAESGRFEETLTYIYKNIDSPFGFFNGLAEYIEKAGKGEIQKISQPDAFLMLGNYSAELLGESHRAVVFGKLCLDFEANEHKKAPTKLRQPAGE